MEIRLPQLGEGADSGSVATIFVKVGDTLRENDPMLELESEKAVASIPSPAAGKVTQIHVSQGDTIKVGQLILSVEAAAAEPAPKPTGDKPPAAKSTAAPAPTVAAPAAAEAEPGEVVNETVVAAPSVRRIAREIGLDLRRIRGSESGGRIVLGDLRAYIQRLQQQAQRPAGAAAPAAKPVAESIDFSKWGEITKKPLSQLRKVIAQRMVESATTVPQVTQFDDADITAVGELRKQHAAAYEQAGGRLTFTPILLQALATTLKQHPLLNSSLDEAAQEIVFKEYCHIGIAVDTEHGLIVPVLRDVDKKDLLTLAQELEALAEKAKQRKLSGDELKGGSFTISNQGGIGGAHFTPIVNKPEVAILGLGRGTWRAVVTKDKEIAPRLMLPLCLSYDHRVIDGANAARFMVDLVTAIETFPAAALKL